MRPWLELARISNLPTVWTNVLAGWLLAGGKWDWQPLTWLLIGGSLLYTGGMILNDAADVKFDREHRKERPIPSGRVPALQAWTVGLSMMLAGAVMAVWGAAACIWLTSGLVAAILFYDLYHKPWAGSVFVMGSCRTLLYLVAASAAAEHLNVSDHWEVILKAIALGGYVVGLSLVARRESSHATPGGHRYGLGGLGLTLPWIVLAGTVGDHEFTIGLFGLMMIAYAYWFLPFQSAGKISKILAALLILCVLGVARGFMGLKGPGLTGVSLEILTAGFLSAYAVVVDRALRLMRTPPKSNIGRAVGLLLAAIPLVDALAVCQVAPWTALCFALSLPLLLLWQRKIAAT